MDQTTKKNKAAQEPAYVKGPEQLEQAPEYTFWNRDEFPTRRSVPDISRRDVLKIAGGAVALAGMASGCRFLPERKIVPFVVQPEDQVTGKAVHYASAFILSGYATGVLATSHEGRPTFLAGNPKHPMSLGASHHFAIAEMANLYDPDRKKNPQFKGDPGSWEEFLRSARQAIKDAEPGSVAILTETVGSPALAASLTAFEEQTGAKWRQYEPVNRDSLREGAIQAFGRDVETLFAFDKAKVILSLDADLFGLHPTALKNSHDIMQGRNVEASEDMNRLYAVESFPTTFGATADHRLPLKPSLMGAFAQALAAKLGVPGITEGPLPAGVEDTWISALAKDLASQKGKAVVAAGRHLPSSVHALVHAINHHLGAHGSTVLLTNPVHPRPVNQMKELAELKAELEGGRVKVLIILGGNPAYTAPSDFKLAELIKKVPFSAHLSSHADETDHTVHWTLPESHFLEAWGDGVAADGTLSIVQPLIEPIYDSRSALELVDALLGKSRPGREALSAYWQANQARVGALALVKQGAAVPVPAPAAALAAGAPAAPRPAAAPMLETDFERAWRLALAEGVMTLGKPVSLPVAPVAGLGQGLAAPSGSGPDLLLLPDPTIYDGRYANNTWLQEMPKPITNFTWDNCIFVSPATGKAAGLERNKFLGIDGTQEIEKAALGMGRPMATLTVGDAKLKAATSFQIGQADDTYVLHLGYGRTKGGAWIREAHPEHGGGFNAYQLMTSAAPTLVSGAVLAKEKDFYGMANVQFHNSLEAKYYDKDRNIIREATLEEFKSGEALFKPKEFHVYGLHGPEDDKAKGGHGEEHGHEEGKEKKPLTMWDDSAKQGYDNFNQWAMTVDLNLCTGCGACVVACQSENNIPAVGKRQVQKGREMHWIRIDRYYMGSGDSLDEKNAPIRFMPMACVHCENAPCEPVCPVAATVHSHEGLNQMVYNRCVGTRYCSNNCPYKVRRFNFLHYTMKNDQIPVLQMLNNPDVTVRGRGVMEKCTYCVQRINDVRIKAKKEGREIKDGEVVTACQAACPSKAIIFGDMRRPENAVAKSRASRRNYILLEEANTLPRTTFLMRINNPNPEIEG